MDFVLFIENTEESYNGLALTHYLPEDKPQTSQS